MDGNAYTGLRVYVSLYSKMKREEKNRNLNNACFLFRPPADGAFCSFEILELKNPSIISREIFKWVPGTRSERSQTPIALEANSCRDFSRGVYFIWERQVVFLLTPAIPPLCQSVMQIW
jgi:hypothetical protein